MRPPSISAVAADHPRQMAECRGADCDRSRKPTGCCNGRRSIASSVHRSGRSTRQAAFRGHHSAAISRTASISPSCGLGRVSRRPSDGVDALPGRVSVAAALVERSASTPPPSPSTTCKARAATATTAPTMPPPTPPSSPCRCRASRSGALAARGRVRLRAENPAMIVKVRALLERMPASPPTGRRNLERHAQQAPGRRRGLLGAVALPDPPPSRRRTTCPKPTAAVRP